MPENNDFYSGIGYVWRIRDPTTSDNPHTQTDLFHALVYVAPKDSVDYLEMKVVSEEDNKLSLYTKRLDKTNRKGFTWAAGKDCLAKHPPGGDDCFIFHEHPLKGSEFIEMMYAKGILHPPTPKPKDSALALPPPSGPAVKPQDILSQAIQTIGPSFSGDGGGISDETVLGETVVVDEDAVSWKYWQKRALQAESRAADLTTKLLLKDDSIEELKVQLAASGDAKIRFSANADLASMRVKEFQTQSASPIIEGLKPQLADLPKMFILLKDVSSKLNKLSDIPVMVKGIKEIADTFNIQFQKELGARAAAEASDEPIETNESDMETVLCLMSRLVKIYDKFGFSNSPEPVDVPTTVMRILSSQGESKPSIFVSAPAAPPVNAYMPQSCHPPPSQPPPPRCSPSQQLIHGGVMFEGQPQGVLEGGVGCFTTNLAVW